MEIEAPSGGLLAVCIRKLNHHLQHEENELNDTCYNNWLERRKAGLLSG